MQENSDPIPKFPKEFLWGTASSSHQVEGGTHNQWSEWEQSPKRKSYLEKKGLLKRYGNNNFVSGKNSDQYHLYEKDFALAQELGHTALRFSTEWSRLEPEEGVWDEEAFAHYGKVIASLKEKKMEPFLTLWHWTHPVWFEKKGGWLHPNAEDLFFAYAKKVLDKYAKDVTFLITLNEPEIYASFSYLIGVWPPQKMNPISFHKALGTLLRTHKRIYAYAKKEYPHLQIGIAKNYAYFEAYPNDPINRAIRRAMQWWWNEYVLRKTEEAEDFIGLNYYFHHGTRFGFLKKIGERFSDVGWGLSPSGLGAVLAEVKRFGKPIYITEHGLADAADANRPWYIAKSLEYVSRAMADGADVRGYLHWSLLDNFEWADGFWPRFGLIGVDYGTEERIVRPSAQLLKKIIKENS